METNKIKIAPSVLASDFSRLGEEVLAMERAGADMIHLDVMDGHFVPNLSFGEPVIASLRKSCSIFFDTHLMISDPLRYMNDFVKAGSNRITFHIECDSDPAATLEAILGHGVEAGLSVKPGTPVEILEPYLEKLAQVLIMTVEPGFGGQKFMADMCSKLDWLAEIRRSKGLSFDIQVDGGIDTTTAPVVTARGANVLVAGSALFSAPDYAQAVEQLRRVATHEHT